MNPRMGFALAHAKQSPLHGLERIGLQVDQDTQQPILGRRQWAVLVGGVPPGGARVSIEPPCRHMGLEYGLKGWYQRAKLIQRETGQIDHLCRTGLDISEPSRAHGGGLLSLEAQDIINRDELYCLFPPGRRGVVLRRHVGATGPGPLRITGGLPARLAVDGPDQLEERAATGHGILGVSMT